MGATDKLPQGILTLRKDLSMLIHMAPKVLRKAQDALKKGSLRVAPIGEVSACTI